jgi:hypothetical protein
LSKHHHQNHQPTWKIIDQKPPRKTIVSHQIYKLNFSSVKNLFTYCNACTPSITNTKQHKFFVRSMSSVVTTMKKEKQTPLLANNKT